jgi:hypothetical protein
MAPPIRLGGAVVGRSQAGAVRTVRGGRSDRTEWVVPRDPSPGVARPRDDTVAAFHCRGPRLDAASVPFAVRGSTLPLSLSPSEAEATQLSSPCSPSIFKRPCSSLLTCTSRCGNGMVTPRFLKMASMP